MRELLLANSVDTEKYVDIRQFEGVLVQAMERNTAHLSRRGHVLPGVIHALSALSAVPTVIQSVLTGNITDNARAKLGAFDLDTWFDLDIGGFGSDDKVRSNLVDAARRKVSKKFDIQFDRSSTILIGDTLLDIKAVHDGGAKILAVATGVHSTTQLAEAGADVVLDTLADLDRFLTALVDLRTNTTSG
jgi:phosphoglycolate phosphatase